MGTPHGRDEDVDIYTQTTGETVLFFQARNAQVPNFDEAARYVVDDDESVGENEVIQPEVFSLRNETSLTRLTPQLVRRSVRSD